MLPLLDVMMVILFIFATVQEARLVEQEAEARMAAADTAASHAQSRDQQKQIEKLQETLAKERADKPVPQDVVDQLLKLANVVELELAGKPDGDGGVINRCCYRTDPRVEAWQSCGLVPPETEFRRQWWQADGASLASALEATASSDTAVVIIRQGQRTTFRIGENLRRLIRGQVPDRKAYLLEGTTDLTSPCGHEERPDDRADDRPSD